MTHVDRTRERCGKSVVFTFNTQTSRLGFIETVPGAAPMGLGASDKLVSDPKNRVGFVEESVWKVVQSVEGYICPFKTKVKKAHLGRFKC